MGTERSVRRVKQGLDIHFSTRNLNRKKERKEYRRERVVELAVRTWDKKKAWSELESGVLQV